ncbi:hypothetical protein Tco_0880507 [Tanacetum coccineum]
MKEVRDKLSFCTSTVDSNSQHVQDLQIMFKDMVSLLEAAEVFKKANAEGEKWEKNNPAEEQDAQHPDQTKGEKTQGPTLIILFRGSNHKLKLYQMKKKLWLKSLGFSEWLEVHALASKKSGKSNYMLLKSLRAKFQWVINQAKKLGLPPPSALVTFEMTAEDKKRKRKKILEEVFWKWISEKRTKNQAKNDKTKHGMEKHQSQSQSQPRKSQQSNPKPQLKNN